MYCDAAGFKKRFGEKELAELLPEEDGDGRGYAAAAADADSLIDSYLAARYVVPLATVPSLIKGIAADLTRYELYDDAPPKEVAERRKFAMEQLDLLREGDLLLPGIAVIAPSVTATIGVSAADTVFKPCVTDRFVGNL